MNLETHRRCVESIHYGKRLPGAFLTKTNTFQKFYAPGELESFIEQALNAEASTLGPSLRRPGPG